MAEKTEVVLDLSVDQGSMITELERTKKAIIQLKEEQQSLTKAYKAGAVTVDEYAEESVRLEAILKKEQQTYNNTQKAVTGVKTSMDKLTESNNKLASSVKQSTENIRVAGVSVGELATKTTALANPITAVVGVVGALGAAYARSTIGAKDLEFAQNQLSISTGLVLNNFASMISSAEDGEGALSKLTNVAIASIFGINNALQSRGLTMDIEAIQDLQREEIRVRSVINDRLADNQEILAKLQDSQISYNDKVSLSGQAVTNITQNEDDLLNIKKQQLIIAERASNANQADEEKQKIVLDIKREISSIEKDAERRRQAIFKTESNLLDAYNKQNEALKKQRNETEKKINAQEEANRREFEGREVSFNDDPTSKDFDPQQQFEQDADLINAELGLVRTAEQEKQTLALQTNSVNQMIHDENMARMQENLGAAKDNFNQLAGLFTQGSEARKVFALLGIGADTAQAISSLTANSEANPANAFTFGGAGIAQYAAGIVRILTNIAAAKEFLGGSFAGGADFVTTKPTMIMVGDNPGHRERVTVQPLSGKGKSSYNKSAGLAKFGGGGSMTFDGASASANADVTQALATSNAIKNMPVPEVAVKEISRVQRRVAVKERVSRG